MPRKREREQEDDKVGETSIHSVIIELGKLHEYMQVVQSKPLCSRKVDMTAQGRRDEEAGG